MSKQGQRCRQVIKYRERHAFWWTSEFVSVKLKTRKVLQKFFKVTEKVMESHGIWTAQKSTNPDSLFCTRNYNVSLVFSFQIVTSYTDRVLGWGYQFTDHVLDVVRYIFSWCPSILCHAYNHLVVHRLFTSYLGIDDFELTGVCTRTPANVFKLDSVI